MTKTRVEETTLGYWLLSKQVRHPTYPCLTTTEQALKYLGTEQKRLDPNRLIAQVLHELTFDIIEGGTQWRQSQQSKSFRLMHFTKK